MSFFSVRLSHLSQPLPNLIVAAALALGLSAPAPLRAGPGDALGTAIVLGAVGTIAYCATHQKACDANAGNGAARGPVDAIALSREQAMWVQQGLQSLGYYQGGIDGALGAGSRAAIRSYQADLGEPRSGALTGKQINDLVALAPPFAGVAPGDPFLFNADLANDVTRDEMRQIQAGLNNRGFDAGTVDGAFGGMTRDAVAAYKASYGLPGGPVASRRLLAHLMGWAPAAQPVATPAMVAPTPAAPKPTAPKPTAPKPVVAAPAAPVPTQPAAAAPMADTSFDLVGLSLGMTEAEAGQAVAAQLGPDQESETASGDAYGGGATLGQGTLAQQASWPTPPAERMLTLYDPARPDLGVVAAFRLIRMPATVDQGVFESQVLPDIIAKYGTDARVGDSLTWVGNGAARAAAASDPTRLAACGSLRLASVADGLWSTGGGVRLDPLSLGTVSADCGPVLSVDYEDSIIRIGLWNSTALSGAVSAPQIKF